MNMLQFIAETKNVSGVYLIIHNPSRSVYVGQSNFTNMRIQEHHEALTSHTHHNRKLQALWDSSLPDAFSVRIYLESPKTQTALERQQWLVWSERETIYKMKKDFTVLNIAPPEIVETANALAEFEEQMKSKSKRLSSERRMIKKRIDEINIAINPFLSSYHSCRSELYILEDKLKKSRGLFSVLFGRQSTDSIQVQEARINQLKERISEIGTKMAPLEAERQSLEQQYKSLYNQFPKVSAKIFEQALPPCLRITQRKRPRIPEAYNLPQNKSG